MTYLEVGNATAIEGYEDPKSRQLRFRTHPGETVTVWRFPEDTSALDCYQIVLGSIDRHFALNGKPPWIDTDNDTLRDLLLEHFGLDPSAVGQPAGWGDPEHPVVTPLAPTETVGFLALNLGLLAVLGWQFGLRTMGGRDHQARVMGDNNSTGTGAYSSGSIMAVSQDDTTPDLNDLSLPGEITTGNLARKLATYGHTVGTGSYTLTALWSIDQNVTLYKIGIYAGDNTLVFESMLDAPVIGKPGDSTTITETVTI